jgi:thiol-disulfide isomerase/thioredoxin
VDEPRPAWTAKLRRIALVILVGAALAWTLQQRYGFTYQRSGPVLTAPVPGVERATVFHFFTDTCPYCKQMAPALKRAEAACAGGPVEFREINLQGPDAGSYNRDFRVESVPTTVYVDATGMERERYVGAMSERAILTGVEKLTGKACPAG